MVLDPGRTHPSELVSSVAPSVMCPAPPPFAPQTGLTFSFRPPLVATRLEKAQEHLWASEIQEQPLEMVVVAREQ